MTKPISLLRQRMINDMMIVKSRPIATPLKSEASH
jgi:hypothetical protein